jgi:hypothetical protein
MTAAILAALLWLQLQFGALRVLARLPGGVGDVALAVVWVASAVGAWMLVRGTLAPRLPWRALRTPWPAVVLVALTAACALLVYPSVDDRRSTGGGSDADDAVVLVVEQIRDGEDPFALDTYLGNPPTTGPGSALWAAPFPGRHAYAVAIVVALGATLALLRRWSGSWALPSLASLLIAVSVPWWEGVAQGTDHLAMSCGLAVVTLGVQRESTRRWVLPVLAVAAGILATWRAAYLHLPVLLAIALWPRDRRRAVVFAVAGVGVALLLHGVLLSWTADWDSYDPVQQLVVKSDEDLGAGGRALVLGITVLAGALVIDEARRTRPDPATLVLAGIGGPLAGIAIAGALVADDPAAWSEASYLLPTLVLASVVAARAVLQSRPHDGHRGTPDDTGEGALDRAVEGAL